MLASEQMDAGTANATERLLRPPFDDCLYATIAERICLRFPDACVVLFGSRAYGKPRDDSDVDVLVVANADGGLFAAAGQAYQALQPRDVSVDVVFMTPEIFRARRSGFDPFVREILERGRLLRGRYP